MGRWARFFSRRRRMMEDLDQDIRDFIERETQDNIERGLPPDEARYAALRKFGNVTRVKEETWEVWSFVWLEQLWQDNFTRSPHVRQIPRLCRRRAHTRSRHRRQHSDLQRGKRGAAAAVALSEFKSASFEFGLWICGLDLSTT